MLGNCTIHVIRKADALTLSGLLSTIIIAILIAVLAAGIYFAPLPAHDAGISKHASHKSALTNAVSGNILAGAESSGGPHKDNISIAFVQPTFTYAAYQLHGFYNFYSKHIHVQEGTNVTNDLNLLNVKVPHGPFLLYSQHPGNTADIPQKGYMDTLLTHMKSNMTNAIISNITDREINDGLIFARNATRENNAYDMLFLFHEEYSTQSQYDNLRKFVSNGGTIVFNDANILTTQVKYDSGKDIITLVRGHTWQFNGKSAWRVERERWANETSQWVGSNFLDIPTKENLTFLNNPFNYNHAEEQYITNSKDKIILDFGARDIDHKLDAKDPSDSDSNNNKVACYELDYGKGRVIMLGIFAHKLVDNNNFLNFYDEKIIPLISMAK